MVARIRVARYSGAAMECLSSGRMACLAVLTAALLAVALPQAAAADGLGFSYTPSKTEPYAVCGRPTPGHSACHGDHRPDRRGPILERLTADGEPLRSPARPITGSGVGGGFSPADLRSAYNLPSESAGSGQTVAIVDAYDDPKAESDLACVSLALRAPGVHDRQRLLQEGQPERRKPPTTRRRNPAGRLRSHSTSTWSRRRARTATSCWSRRRAPRTPTCTRPRTRRPRSGRPRSATAMKAQRSPARHRLTRTSITRGWLIFASAGDAGYGVRYPAASQYVIAVGGTALNARHRTRAGGLRPSGEGTGKRLQRL